MPAAYSLDLRERVVATVDGGISRRGAAGQFKAGISTVIRRAARLAATGSCAAKRSCGDRKSKAVEAQKDWHLDLVKAEPDLTLAEILFRLHATHGLSTSFSCLWRLFARHDITFEKTPHAAEQDRDDVKAVREAVREDQASLMPKSLVFIDGTATTTNMTRWRGRAPDWRYPAWSP